MPAQANPRQGRQTRPRPNTQLIELRINAGLTREDLARLTGVSRETIRLLETTNYVPGVHVQAEIARQFDLRPLDLWPLERQKVVKR